MPRARCQEPDAKSQMPSMENKFQPKSRKEKILNGTEILKKVKPNPNGAKSTKENTKIKPSGSKPTIKPKGSKAKQTVQRHSSKRQNHDDKN